MVTLPKTIGAPYVPDCVPTYILYPARSVSVFPIQERVAELVEDVPEPTVSETGRVLLVAPVADTVMV